MSVDPTTAKNRDATPGYRGAVEGLAVFERADRALLTVTGRAPTKMLNGVLTGVMPPVPVEVEPGVHEGRATYHAVLTPKGKMVSDLYATLLGPDDGPGFLLDVPRAGLERLQSHLGKFLPPRFAKVDDVTVGSASAGERDSLAVVGPEAPAALSKLALGLRVDPQWLEGAEAGAWRCVGDPPAATLVTRTDEVWPPAWVVYGPLDAVSALRRALVADGAVEATDGDWEILRVEAGRPLYGADMNDGTLPPEAGIVDRAIDHAKGCYTGQEVIVRIRDRGHVNRELRRLELGDGPLPQPGTVLFAADGTAKEVGWITSVATSPRAGGVLALAYVRRDADEVRLGDRTIPVPAGFPEPLS